MNIHPGGQENRYVWLQIPTLPNVPCSVSAKASFAWTGPMVHPEQGPIFRHILHVLLGTIFLELGLTPGAHPGITSLKEPSRGVAA
eukprot:scaffold5920_cov172-Amphora_coffeaeformis.AAC.5